MTNKKHRPAHIAFVSCTGMKASEPCAAEEMYRWSWFKYASAYVKSWGCEWYILSAKHGLLRPDEVIAPYNVSLKRQPPMKRRRWAYQVYVQCREIIKPESRVTILAGKAYREFLVRFLNEGMNVEVDYPVEGLGNGYQVSWFKENTK